MTDTTTTDDGDWLGYGVYADTLWARIVRALDKDDLGDDPLVIGLFGEWGAGKSYLLNMMQDEAKSWVKDRIGMRKQLGGDGVVLTVPVLFQPWKYEHEAHLLVPMMLHILYALQEYTSKTRTNWDKAGGVTEAAWEGVKKSMPKVVGLFEKATTGAIAAMEPNTAAAAGIGLGVAKSAAGLLKPRDDKPNALKNYKNSNDGRFFYELHQTLKDVTRPTRENGLLKEHFNYPFRLNFVVFIDDLDRCLPEKAVQTLEMIKTIFNVDSFAFVLALDDEVIERGIGHRYQAYNFAGKKPEMPITGFEYLEKIVHLPFKLPALTQTQAKKFIEHLEDKIAPKGGHWFQQTLDINPNHQSRELSVSEKVDTEALMGSSVKFKRVDIESIRDVFDLSDLTLKAFDAYVPRKLTRLVELWYNTVEIAKKRHAKDSRKELLAAKRNAQIDIRIAFAVLMVQLFHPDLYRVFRRHEETFSTLYHAFDASAKPESTLSASMSDIDLWHWAAYRQNKDGKPTELKMTLEHMSKLDDGYRYDAQQKRLPLVERLIEHRAAQRHVFDALKLFAALKKQMPALPNDFKIAQYFSLLSEFDEMLTPVSVEVEAQINESAQVTDEFSADVIPASSRFTTDANRLYTSVISADPVMQEYMTKLPEFVTGKYLLFEQAEATRQRVHGWLLDGESDGSRDRRERQLLGGLTYLLRYIAPAERKHWRSLIQSKVDFGDTEALIDPKFRAQWHDVRAALGQDDRFDDKFALPKRPAGDALEAPAGFVKISPTADFVRAYENAKSDNPIEYPNYDYYISRFPVTVAQFEVFRQSSEFKELMLILEKKILLKMPSWDIQLANQYRPAVNVNWFEATAYARWLQVRLEVGDLGVIDVPKGYVLRLPTDAEWEYAARGGLNDKIYPWGNEVDDIDQRANVNQKVGHATTVGIYSPNAFGLFDMAGNVWEWQANSYNEGEDAMSLRGGSWINIPDSASCSNSSGFRSAFSSDFLGFRLVFAPADFTS
jgi:formylglycine-generating enzyme required for sulfatase activity